MTSIYIQIKSNHFHCHITNTTCAMVSVNLGSFRTTSTHTHTVIWRAGSFSFRLVTLPILRRPPHKSDYSQLILPLVSLIEQYRRTLTFRERKSRVEFPYCVTQRPRGAAMWGNNTSTVAMIKRFEQREWYACANIHTCFQTHICSHSGHTLAIIPDDGAKGLCWKLGE